MVSTEDLSKNPVPYAELHARSYFSFLEASSSPQDLVGEAYRLGYQGIALTDLCGLYGVIPFAKEAKDLGMHWIAGSSMVMEDGVELVLLARNQTGYESLCRHISLARHRCEKGRFLYLWKDLLEGDWSDWICLVGVKFGRIRQELEAGNQIFIEERLLQLKERFFANGNADCLYLELNHHQERGDEKRIRNQLEWSRKLEIPVVAAGAAHYASRDQAALRDILLCIKHRLRLEEKEAYDLRFGNFEYGLREFDRLKELFREVPEALYRSVEIANSCQVDLNFEAYRFPEFPVPKDHTVDSYLRLLCEEGLERKYPNPKEEVLERLEEELALISQKKLSGYFLVVWDLVQFALKRGVRCQGRGSAANSMVAYLLQIMPVDPIKHGLFFGRFLNEETETSPDIDLDFASTPSTGRPDREEVIQYVYSRYGADHVAMVCTMITFRARSAIREVGQVLGMPEKILDKMAKMTGSYSYENAFAEISLVDDLQEYTRSRNWKLFHEMVDQIIDVPRHLSIHVGGMLISSLELNRVVPLEPARMNNRVVCQWDKDMVEDAGLVKVDLLGLRMLSVLEETRELIHEDQGIDVDLEFIPREDEQVFKMISEADTVGVFQVESRAQMQSLPRTTPSSFEELAVQVAIIRPGPLQGKMVNPYIRRKQGEEPVEYLHPLLKPVLEETLGVILFQEQVLKVAVTLAGFRPGQAEQLRKAMSRKRSRAFMQKLEKEFFEGCRRNPVAVDEEDARKVFQSLQGFALYGFCKSHALAFANISYLSAYLRRYFPAAFTASLLNNQPMGFYPRAVLLRDAKRMGVEFLPVDLKDSRPWCHLQDGRVRLGLCLTKSLGLDQAKKIVEERSLRDFEGLTDFVRRTQTPVNVCTKLIQSGAMDCFGLDRRELLWQLGLLFSPDFQWQSVLNEGLKTPELPLSTSWDQLKSETEVLGFGTKNHPLQFFRKEFQSRGIGGYKLLNSKPDGADLSIAGMVVCRQRPPTAKGFGFLTLEDEDGMMNVIVPPDVYDSCRLYFRRSPLLIVKGFRISRDGVVNLKARSLHPLQLGNENTQGSLSFARS